MNDTQRMNYQDLGIRIRQQREALNLTQGDLAKRICVTASFIGQIERAEKVPSLETAARLSNALDTTMDWLVFGNRHKCDGKACPLFDDLDALIEYSAPERAARPAELSSETGGVEQRFRCR